MSQDIPALQVWGADAGHAMMEPETVGIQACVSGTLAQVSAWRMYLLLKAGLTLPISLCPHNPSLHHPIQCMSPPQAVTVIKTTNSYSSLQVCCVPGMRPRAFPSWVGAGSQHMRSHPWQGHEEKTWQVRQIRTSGISKSCPGAHLKDDLCLSDACYIRLLPNFCDTGRRPSSISLQTEST